MLDLGRRRASRPRDTPAKRFLQSKSRLFVEHGSVLRGPQPLAVLRVGPPCNSSPPKVEKEASEGFAPRRTCRTVFIMEETDEACLQSCVVLNSRDLEAWFQLLGSSVHQDLLYPASAGHAGWFADAGLILR